MYFRNIGSHDIKNKFEPSFDMNRYPIIMSRVSWGVFTLCGQWPSPVFTSPRVCIGPRDELQVFSYVRATNIPDDYSNMNKKLSNWTCPRLWNVNLLKNEFILHALSKKSSQSKLNLKKLYLMLPNCND
jgi:hypothetical protein